MGVLLRKETLFHDSISEPFSVVIASDFHIQTARSVNLLKRAVNRINAAAPDLVFLLGDYVNGGTYDFSPLNIFGELDCDHGVYAVMGNHDYHTYLWKRTPNLKIGERVRSCLEAAGVTVLRNNSRIVDVGGTSLAICGLDDRYSLADYDSTFAGTESADMTILLAHDPNHIVKLKKDQRPDIMLSGHTHGFQMRLPIIGPLFPYIPTPLGRRYDFGFHRYGNRLMYITTGVGNLPLSFRMRCPSEVVFFELLPEN